jgi:dienelactone hydrolase
MGDHAVLIPTSLGPVGGVVSEPGDERRAALVLLQGAGRPARSGVNSFWTGIARALAERGVVVVRFDYAAEGESIEVGEGDYSAAVREIGSGPRGRAEVDLHLLGEVVAWFRARLDGQRPLFAGLCQGARMALELVAMDPQAAGPCFLIAPYLRKPASSEPIDPLVVSSLEASLKHVPTCLLVGEMDEPDVGLLLDRLSPTAIGLELEVVPAVALHLLDQPEVQRKAGDRLLAGVDRYLAGSGARCPPYDAATALAHARARRRARKPITR